MAGSINNLFQDDNLTDKGVPYVSVLLNIAVESFDDQQLITNSISPGSGSHRRYQNIGIDAAPNRTDKELHGFNYFRLSQMGTTTFIPGDRRRVVIMNGFTGEVLINEEASGSASQSARIIAALNSIEAPPDETFGLWISEAGVPASSQGENDDPDGDGLVNLLEYALGTNPAVADGENGPQILRNDGTRVFQFSRSKSAAVTPLVIEMGSTLENIATYSPSAEDVSVSDLGETERVSVTLPSNLDRVFIRLRTGAQ